MQKSLIALCCATLFSSAPQAAETAAAPEYAIVNKIHLTGDGGWDYCALDDATGRLFVSHEMQVQVVDVATHEQIGAIANTRGVHGIAFVKELNKAYISDGKDTAVSIVDLKTLALLKKVHVSGIGPDGIVYDPFSKCIFTCNGKTENATGIGVKNDKVVATIALGGKPEASGPDNKGRLYVNLEDKSEVAVVNTKSMKVEAKWPVAPGEEPSAMAIDNQDHRLFLGCRNKTMVVMDAQSGKVITTLPIGDHVDAAAFDPVTKRVFCSNGDGTVTVVAASVQNAYAVVENIVTQKGAKTMALSPTTHHLYLPTAEYEAAPAVTADNPKPRASVKSGSFMVLDVAPVGK